MSNLFLDEGLPAKGQKVLLATTVYDKPDPCYVFSIQKTRHALEKANIQTAYLILSGNCHVDDARNSVVQEFLQTDCTDLIFLDADVAWEPSGLIALCNAQADIVGGIYPYRREGVVDKLPVLLKPGNIEVNQQGLLEVIGIPAGFMRITRHVLVKMCETAQHFKARGEQGEIPILFERTVEDSNRFGGDISFCRKWRKMGGKIYAMPEIRLSHAGGTLISDSLGAYLRRTNRTTLKYMVDRIRANDFDPYLFEETRQYIGNKWGALEDVLMMCALLGKQAQGPIIETGTGLTSIVLAVASNQPVYCLEHDPYWAKNIQELAQSVNVNNVNVIKCDIKNRWYDWSDNLPEQFALGLNDGPPRYLGSRMGFFEHFGETETIIADDADDPGYKEALSNWVDAHSRRIDFVERSALIRS